jgi:hypothetical protein
MAQNILGAPAEGFSQTISFAARRTQDPQDAVGSPGPVRDTSQVSGGAGAGLATQQVSAEPPLLASFLMKIGEAALAPKLKEARTKAFVNGMHRAAAGEQLGEIAEDQPWYSKIFGDPAAVQGARAYTQQAKASELAVSIEEAMPKLRSQSVAQASEFFSGLVNKSLTGDDETDAVLMASLSKVLPGAMRKHAREHYQYQQEQALAGQSTAISAGAKLLQGGAGDVAAGKLTAEEYEVQQAEFAQQLIKPDGQELESWQKARAKDVITMAENGQFFAIKAARKAGLFEALTPEQQAAVTRSIEANEAQWRGKLATQYVTPLYEIGVTARLAPPGSSVGKLKKQIDELNTTFSRATGIDAPLIGAFQEAQTMEQLAAGIQSKLDQQARDTAARAAAAKAAGAGELGEALTTQGLAQQYAAGQLDNYELTGAKRKQADAWHMGRVLQRDATGTYQITNDPQELRLTALNAAAGYVNSTLATQLRAQAADAMIEGVQSKGFLSVYNSWKKLSNGVPGGVGASKYFGEDLDQRFSHFDKTVNPNDPSSMAAAFQRAFAGERPAPVRHSDKDAKAAVATAVSKLGDWRATFMPSYRMAPGQTDIISSEIRTRMGYFGDDAEVAATKALAAAQAKGFQVFGGYAWKGPEEFANDSGMHKRLEQAVTVSTKEGVKPKLSTGEELSKDFKSVMDGLVAGLSKDAKTVRIADFGKALQITVEQKDRTSVSETITWSQIADGVAALQVGRRKEPKPVPAPAPKPPRNPLLSQEGLDPNTLLPKR